MSLEYLHLTCRAAMHRKGVDPSSMHPSTCTAVTVILPWGQRCYSKGEKQRCWHPPGFSSLSFPLRAGRKRLEQEGEWIAGRAHGVGASAVKTAKLPMLTGHLHPGNFLQNQRKRKVFAKGKTVRVNENIHVCFVHVLNHLDDNWWTYFNSRPLKISQLQV